MVFYNGSIKSQIGQPELFQNLIWTLVFIIRLGLVVVGNVILNLLRKHDLENMFPKVKDRWKMAAMLRGFACKPFSSDMLVMLTCMSGFEI